MQSSPRQQNLMSATMFLDWMKKLSEKANYTDLISPYIRVSSSLDKNDKSGKKEKRLLNHHSETAETEKNKTQV